MKKILLLILILPIFAQSQISLNSYLNSLKSNHPAFVSDDIFVERIREEQNSLRDINDWQFQSEISASYYEPTNPYFSDFDKISKGVIQGNLSRYLWNTGGSFYGGLYLSGGPADYIDESLGSSEMNYENSIHLGFEQPLLRNFGGKLAKLPFNLKEFEIEKIKLQRLDAQETLLIDAAKTFIRWVYLLEKRDLLDQRYVVAEIECEDLVAKGESNVVDEIDVIRAESHFELTGLNYEIHEAELENHLALLSVKSGIKNLERKRPNLDFFNHQKIESFQSLSHKLSSNSRIIKLLRTQIGQIEMIIAGKEHQELTKLQLFGDMSLGKNDEDLKESIVINNPSISVGLKIDFPLENKVLESEIKAQKLIIEEVKNEIDIFQQIKLEQISVIHSKLLEIITIVKLQEMQIEILSYRSQAEQNAYAKGKVDYSFVIQAQDKEYDTKLAHLENLYKFHSLYYELQNLTDSFHK